MDVILGNSGDDDDGTYMRVLINDGTGSFVEKWLSGEQNGVSSIVTGDVNGGELVLIIFVLFF